MSVLSLPSPIFTRQGYIMYRRVQIILPFIQSVSDQFKLTFLSTHIASISKRWVWAKLWVEFGEDSCVHVCACGQLGSRCKMYLRGNQPLCWNLTPAISSLNYQGINILKLHFQTYTQLGNSNGPVATKSPSKIFCLYTWDQPLYCNLTSLVYASSGFESQKPI